MVTKKVKAVELVRDWNLWPRHEAGDLDQTNITRMKKAIQSGVKLPPVLVNKSDNRVIDGFHRVEVALRLYGDDAEIEATFKEYGSEAEMFIESARLNNSHGLPLSPRDRVHTIMKARRYKIPMPVIAEALGLESEEAKRFLEKRTAKSKSGERVPLSGGALGLAGKTLTKQQEDYVKSAPGTSAQMYARLLLNALKADAIVYNEKVIDALRQLRVKIDTILAEVE